MTTIHLIASAHLDPVWMWPWQAGLDEVLATCRSACDRLDAHPDLIFTRGEAWVYRQIERVNFALFARICAHIEAGRWEIVGGWWVQPDCNLPSGWGLEKQIDLGRSYFQSRFRRFPDIAYNVDSFGHTASLSAIMRANGQRFYVMMRPQEWEMTLPARLFRWRGHEDGPEVTTFRIAGSYMKREMSLSHVENSLTDLPDGITHTMCFIGVGNHGGGPTEKQIAWCREHQNAIPNAKLEFSSPSSFFAAIESQIDSLPLVTGELQQHAIGCYSVCRSIKVATRRAENLLRQAQTAVPDADLQSAWEKVCFAHFHDTLGGTSTDTAYPQQLDALGYAATVSDETLQFDFRRRLSTLPDDTHQRIVAFNASDKYFDGHLEFEPWLDWQDWDDSYWLSDENGAPVPFQRTYSDSMVFQIRTENTAKWGLPHLVFPAHFEAGALGVWHVERGTAPAFSAPDFEIGFYVAAQTLRFGQKSRPFPQFALIEDATDTWSHRYSDTLHQSYAEAALEIARFAPSQMVDDGPVFRAWSQTGNIGNSRLEAEWRIYAGEAFVELWVRVLWLEKHKLLKLVWSHDGAPIRTDGIAGGQLERPNDGRELPLRDWTKNGESAIVCPDVFALDATPERTRLTLLRSPLVAHHDPHEGRSPRARVADQGAHEFTFRFFAGEISTRVLDIHAQNVQSPPLLADLTRGMEAR